MAPHRSDIDLSELEKLSGLQCTDEEIAAWFNVSTRTIERRRLEPEFANVMDRGRAKGRFSVRRLQMKLLEQGNATMGVWLGKNILNQVDTINFNTNTQLVVQQQASLPAPSGPVIDIEPTTIDV